jgi:hypothetical protein
MLLTAELLYEAEIRFTSIVEYGVSMEALSSGLTAPPPDGARFDQSFEGSLYGPRLRGRITGTDYLQVSADGRFHLHIHAQIKTDDGQDISFASDGVTYPGERSCEAELRATVSLFSSSPAYKWLNPLHIWALGSLDLDHGRALVRAYFA